MSKGKKVLEVDFEIVNVTASAKLINLNGNQVRSFWKNTHHYYYNFFYGIYFFLL